MSATNEGRSLGRKLDGDAEVDGDIKRRIKDGAEELVARGEAALVNVRTRVRGQVQDRPLTSLAVAGGIGLLLGLLIARKR